MTTPMSPESAHPFGAPAPDGQPAQRLSSAASLVLVSVALLAGAAGTFVFLSAHPSGGTMRAVVANGSATSSPPPASPAATAAATRAITHRWSRDDEYRWTANRKQSVAYELEADQQVRVWTTHVRPALVIRCLNRRTEVFVFTETPSKLESSDGLHSVKLRFDDAPASDQRWPDSAEHDALFAPDGAALARRISSAHHLRFGFSPHNADPVQVDFDLRDAATVVSHVAKTCGWNTEK
jgi:Type VI secretion system VasI, EvfG, VC_A0118